jgi:hypothetical protein
MLGLAGLHRAQAQDYPAGETPILNGCVSAITSYANFSVEGKPVVTTPQTAVWKHYMDGGQDVMKVYPKGLETLAVGDEVKVFGRREKHTHFVLASEILVSRKYQRVTGYAVVQRVVATSPRPVLEADGYYIAIAPRTVVKDSSSLTGKIPPVNAWIHYGGKFDHTGFVVAHHIVVSSFRLSKRLQKGLRKSEGDLIAPDYGTAAQPDAEPGQLRAPYIYGRKNTAIIPADLLLQDQCSALENG